MIRRIIRIDDKKCDGCGWCAEACHEGAIGIINGKAKLLRDDYCDGLGDCLPVCPAGAIAFEEREAMEYDEVEATRNIERKNAKTLPCGCPGSNAKVIAKEPVQSENSVSSRSNVVSHLQQWPVQIKLVPVNAPYFDGAKLLIAADCAAYARASFHEDFIKGRITLIGCPKLDENDYSEKLTEILTHNNIMSITVVRMEVPCCKGIESAVMQALQNCGKMIRWQAVVIGIDGKMLD